MSILWAVSILIIGYLNLFLFIALDNWGRPLTHDIAGVYFNELNQLVAALPFPTWVVVLVNVLPILLIWLLSYWLAGKTGPIPLVYRGGIIKWKLVQLCGYFLPLLITASVLKMEWPHHLITSSFSSSFDPVLTFLYPRKLHGESFSASGDYLRDAKAAYPTSDKGGKNVILIICDALRADHLGAYGYERPVSPFFDSLAALPESVLHTTFFSDHSRSFPGITDILSSTAEVTFHKFFLHDVLQLQGYKTHFILSGDHTNFFHLKGYLGKSIDLYHDGFDYLQEPYNGQVSVNDDLVHVAGYIGRLPAFSDQSNFLYLHLMSTHQISTTSAQFRRYQPDEASVVSLTSEILINDYDNRMLQLDASLKATVKALEKQGLLDDAVLIITGDHGQALLEDGKNYWHGKSTGMPETHVPLLIYMPGDATFSSRRVKRFGDHLDVAPTILELVNILAPEVWEGQSIFTSEVPHRVLQKEKQFYSLIDLVNDSILVQYTYRTDLGKSSLLNINDLSAPVLLLPQQYMLDSLRQYITLDRETDVN